MTSLKLVFSLLFLKKNVGVLLVVYFLFLVVVHLWTGSFLCAWLAAFSPFIHIPIHALYINYILYVLLVCVYVRRRPGGIVFFTTILVCLSGFFGFWLFLWFFRRVARRLSGRDVGYLGLLWSMWAMEYRLYLHRLCVYHHSRRPG